jgi:hypothetical protein
VVALEDLGRLDALPGGGDLDQDAVLGDALGGVELGGGVSRASSGRTIMSASPRHVAPEMV